jgi:hypothetical protein
MSPGIAPPTITFRVEPEYTPEAREAKYRGTVVVAGVVHEDGTLEVIKSCADSSMALLRKQWRLSSSGSSSPA